MRRIRSGIVAVTLVAALTGAVAASQGGQSDLHAVPIVSPAPALDVEPARVEAVREAALAVPDEFAGSRSPVYEAAGLAALPAPLPGGILPSAESAESTSGGGVNRQAPAGYSVPAVDIATGALLSQPIQGRRTSRFGNRFHPVLHRWKLHTGLDFAAPCGTPVGAAAPGRVTRVGWAGGNGMQVRLDHGRIGGHHVVTTYNHLSAIGVRVGQEVSVHQGVGRVGNTGYSTGCHLHFEVIADGWFTNPEGWLNGGRVVVDTSVMNAGPVRTIPTASASPSLSPSPSMSPSLSPSPSMSPSPSPSPSMSPSASPSPSVSTSPSMSPSPAMSPSPSPGQPGASPSPSGSPDVGASPTPTCAPATGATPPASCGPEASRTPSATCDPAAPTPDPDCAPGPSATPTGSPAPTGSPSASAGLTPTPTASGTQSATPSLSPSSIVSSAQPSSAGPSATVVQSPSHSPSRTTSGTTPSATSEVSQ